MPRDDRSIPGHPSGSRVGKARLPVPNFAHVRALTGRWGIWEHARYSTPRREHGSCTDDNARALVVVSRQAAFDANLADLTATYLGFVLDARTASGPFHNRRDAAGVWTDHVGSDDCQGRAWWGLGTAARLAPDPGMRAAAADAFVTCSAFESPHLRANAYAALGAAEIARSDHRSRTALEFLDRSSMTIAAAARATIPWPETRLTYDNARLPEALIAAGDVLGDRVRLALGVRLLEWLIGAETNGDHFSFTPVGGREPGGRRPGFDQQPLEAWAMADASFRTWTVTGEPAWRMRALDAASWLVGSNDTATMLYDDATGGTRDGLMVASANENRGAESTLAGIGALQVAARCNVQSRDERLS